MRASGSIVVSRPQKAVFEFMDVPENQGRISPRLSRVETVNTLDNGGKRATYVYKLFGQRFEGEVHGIEHDPPERVTFEMTGDIDGEIQWTFESVADGTLVTYSAEYDLGLPRVVEWLLGPVVDRFNQREIDRTLENLQRRVEAT
jgi:carbon monoxide dehydrogenase subunit G